MEFVREKSRIRVFNKSKLKNCELYEVKLYDGENMIFGHKYCRFMRYNDDGTEATFKIEDHLERQLGSIDIRNGIFTRIRVSPSSDAIDAITDIMKERIIYEWIDGVFEKGEPYHIQRFDENGRIIENFVGLYRLTQDDRIMFATVDSNDRPNSESVWIDCAGEYKITPFKLEEEE